MVQGTPVVCSDVDALGEVAGGAARLVPVGDDVAWTAALSELLASPERRVAMAAAGRARAAEFTWERTALATRAVYVEALEADGR